MESPGRSDPDGVGVRQRGVADPALRRAGLDGRQAQEADLQTGDGELGQLEAESEGAHLQHGDGAEAGDVQLQEDTGREDSTLLHRLHKHANMLAYCTQRFLI